jgi:catechol 2,3-dioxygenase-like lactoylglutathione lyase family enzyme
MTKTWTSLGALALALMTAAPAAAQQVTPQLYAVKLAVRDFARTTQFYQLLGLQTGPKHNEWETELRWDDPARGSAIIMVREDASARFHVTRGGGTLVISVADVHAALARLRYAGFAAPGEPKDTGQAAIIMIQDPDGNWVELAGPASAAPKG